MKPLVCECGKIFPVGAKKNAVTNHHRSALHLHGRQVAKLLQDPTLPYMEIARRLGIPVDRVKRLAEVLGGPRGDERLFYSTATRQMTEWWASTGRHPVIQKCKRMGFHVEPIGIEGRSLRLLRWTFLVNGHRVAIAGFSIAGEAQDGVTCVLEPKKSVEVDFQIAHAQGMFYVFPQWLLDGVKDAHFTTGYARPMSRRTNAARPDYQIYRDAWHLLKKTKKPKDEQRKALS
jgi:hypothetical protein